MIKLYDTADLALEGVVQNGMRVLVGGFGPCGVPMTLLRALARTGVRDLEVVSIDAGEPDHSTGLLIHCGLVRKLVAGFVGANPDLKDRWLTGSIEVELCPMGTLMERVRAGGAGIPAFYSHTGVGTVASLGKQTKVFDGKECVLEHAIRGDLALIRAHQSDAAGNLRFRKTARNSNPVMATAAALTIVEAEDNLPVGGIDPDAVHLSGIYVHRIVRCGEEPKRIEHRTVRKRTILGDEQGLS